jgi:sugar lactone lactonase YvrE
MHRMLTGRRTRLLVLLMLIAVGLAMIGYAVARQPEPSRDDGTPLDIQWMGEFGFATLGEGQIVRLTVDGEEVRQEMLADGLRFPRGLAVIDDTLYVAELGELPCENPVPRCKGESVGETTAAGERQILAESDGRILAYPILGDGLGEPAVLIEGLHFVNTDHGLNDLDAGPDGLLYLSVGNLDELAWNDGGTPPDPSATELLGSILRIDPASGEVSVVATGLRNVFGLDFDETGALWGVDNDGRGHGIWRFEELIRLEEGLDYGFPDDGTVGPYERRTGFATWIMPTGAGSSGILVADGVVISGACGRITRVDLETDGGDAAERTVSHRGCTTAIELLPDGRLLLGTVLGGAVFTVIESPALFGN